MKILFQDNLSDTQVEDIYPGCCTSLCELVQQNRGEAPFGPAVRAITALRAHIIRAARAICGLLTPAQIMSSSNRSVGFTPTNNSRHEADSTWVYTWDIRYTGLNSACGQAAEENEYWQPLSTPERKGRALKRNSMAQSRGTSRVRSEVVVREK